jgi:hypothetical protein
VGHTDSMGEMRNVYTILVGKSGRKTLRGMPRSNGNIKMRFVKWSAGVWDSFICLRLGTKPSRSLQSEDHFNGQPIMTGNCTRWILGFMELFSALILNFFIFEYVLSFSLFFVSFLLIICLFVSCLHPLLQELNCLLRSKPLQLNFLNRQEHARTHVIDR